MDTLNIKAYAKLNLFLDITSKRPDGYHELKTVMQSISLCDELEFTLCEGAGIEIECDEKAVPRDENNLIWKGIMAVISYAYFQPGCKIRVKLKKNIPSQAGMGGASADCAAAIAAMDKLFVLGLSEEELITAAKMCGADVPFCITGGTRLCEGIGEKMTALSSLGKVCYAAVKPECSISTPQAYKSFDCGGCFAKGNYDRFSKAMQDSPQALGSALYNAFTTVDLPEDIVLAKDMLIRGGAFGAEMTGSGSAVFGVFDDEEKALKAAQSTGLAFSGVYTPVDKGWCIV